MIKRWMHRAVFNEVSIAPLVTFRILFGLIMLISMVRFASNGWIGLQYVEPSFQFKYFGFHWIPSLGETGFYLLFSIVGLSALGIALGAFYRISTIAFFCAFTWIELVDATYYLNHYYFVSLIGLLLIFIPAHRQHSVDAWLGRVQPTTSLPAVFINVIKLQLCLVYFLAGIAKLNSDWLIEAMPLSLWLPAQSHLPLIGGLMTYDATAYFFSWGGAIYDLCIPFILLSKRWRSLGFLAVIGFHMLTWWFFQIGMFPFIMIGATLIFFASDQHERWQRFSGFIPKEGTERSISLPRLAPYLVSIYIAIQILFPFRYLAYPGDPFWTEQGYRFGWRVMLMEKAGYAQFKVIDEQGREIWVDNADFLTPVQEKMMATQADFIVQYAEHLKTHYQAQGVSVDAVKADVFVTYNGRSSARYVDPETDLSSVDDSWAHKDWIVDINDRDQG